MGRAPFYSVTQDEIMSRACIEDPYSLYARLRNEHPIARIGESGVHAVANWELIDEALGREADFSANLTGVLFRGEDGAPSVFDLSAVGGSHVIATADDPDHAVHRKISQPRLEARRIAKMEPLLRAWTREALSPWIAKVAAIAFRSRSESLRSQLQTYWASRKPTSIDFAFGP